jgi:hypothetical protein
MSLPVLVAFVGVLVTAVATGILAGRCVREPRACFVVWTGAALGLTVAVAAQAVGFAVGFGTSRSARLDLVRRHQKRANHRRTCGRITDES